MLEIERDKVNIRLMNEKWMNENYSRRVKELDYTVHAIGKAIKWMKRKYEKIDTLTGQD